MDGEEFPRKNNSTIGPSLNLGFRQCGTTARPINFTLKVQKAQQQLRRLHGKSPIISILACVVAQSVVRLLQTVGPSK